MNEQIKKAYECCTQETEQCADCPLREFGETKLDCKTELLKQIKLPKQVTYERLRNCSCGSKRIRCQTVWHGKYYYCLDCGYKGEVAKYKYQAITNWNKATIDYKAYHQHQDERRKTLMERWNNGNI